MKLPKAGNKVNVLQVVNEFKKLVVAQNGLVKRHELVLPAAARWLSDALCSVSARIYCANAPRAAYCLIPFTWLFRKYKLIGTKYRSAAGQGGWWERG